MVNGLLRSSYEEDRAWAGSCSLAMHRTVHMLSMLHRNAAYADETTSAGRTNARVMVRHNKLQNVPRRLCLRRCPRKSIYNVQTKVARMRDYQSF